MPLHSAELSLGDCHFTEYYSIISIYANLRKTARQCLLLTNVRMHKTTKSDRISRSSIVLARSFRLAFCFYHAPKLISIIKLSISLW